MTRQQQQELRKASIELREAIGKLTEYLFNLHSALEEAERLLDIECQKNAYIDDIDSFILDEEDYYKAIDEAINAVQKAKGSLK